MTEKKRPTANITKDQAAALDRGEPITVRMPDDVWKRLKGDGPKDEFGITFPAEWAS